VGKKFTQKLLIVFVVIVIFSIGLFLMDWMKNGGTNSAYQHDQDIVRMNDLTKIGQYLEEYKQIKGYYPFSHANEPVRNYVIIGSPEQRKSIDLSSDKGHKETGLADFQSELETVLKKKIDIPFDPQKIATNKPNAYVYRTNKNEFYLTIHLHNSFSFSNKVADNYNQLTISNLSDPTSKVYTLNDLLTNQDFIKSSTEKFYR
jgi:hypothetical protein